MADQDQAVRPDAVGHSSEAEQSQQVDGDGTAGSATHLLPPGSLRERSDDDHDSPTRRRRPRLLVLAAVVLGAITLVVAVVLGPTAWLILQQKDTTLALPDTAGGLTRDTSPEAAATAELLLDVLNAGVNLDTSVSGVYRDPAQGKSSSILFFGGTALLSAPEETLDTVFELLAVQTGAVGGLQKVDAGSLGGTMKCGSADSPEAAMAVCGWADHGSVAFALFPDRTIEEAAPLLQALRPTLQTR
jgi:hypothetical protein